MNRIRRGIVVLLLLVAVWACAAIARGVLSNPFSTARTTACEMGNWSCDSVYFKRGSYSYRLLFTDVEAELVASVGDQSLPVEIELRHMPFIGWRVHRFSVPGDRGDQGCRV